MNEMLSTLQTILGAAEGEEALLRVPLSPAEAAVLAVTGREELPEGLRGAVIDLAAMRYNRRGTEGESVRTEGGVTSKMEALPEDIRRQLDGFYGRPWTVLAASPEIANAADPALRGWRPVLRRAVPWIIAAAALVMAVLAWRMYRRIAPEGE